uniref:Retrovirus-related Pol polyprotein from transposon TNT 1-94 n=1 Tax=Tanacetum cinerariifolium TaxID=118510 RepID=A0A699HTS9_TANCI|nr:retrovirus-related Pol polyprotein from transposon TNT 1-94 [Tanacetum cinerariifolium]
MVRQCLKPKRKRDAMWFRDKVLLVEAQGKGKVLNEEELELLADPAKAVLMANLSSYSSDVLFEVPYSDNTHNATLNQTVHDINSSAQQDAMILSVFEQLSNQIRPMLYDGSVIVKETNVISIADFEETLMLEEESRSKMFLKQSDPMVLEQKVNIKPINYPELNRLSEDFGKCFVPQQELSDEQAFRLQTLHPNTNQSASSPVKIEALLELPKLSLTEAAVQQCHVDKQCFEIQKKQFLIENDRLLDQNISQDIVNIVVNSSLDENASVNVNSFVAMNDSMNYVEICNKCLELKAELIKQHNVVEKDEYNRLLKRFSELEQHCISLEIAMQLNKEIFQKNNTSVNKLNLYLINSFVITALKNDLMKLKGKEIADNVAQVPNATTIASGMYKLDLVTVACKDKNNRETHIYYLKHTIEQAAILMEIDEQARSLNPLDSASYSACKYVKLIQELLGYVRDTCPDIHKPSEKLVAITPINMKKVVRFADTVTSSGNIPKVTNNPLLSSKGVNPSTSASGLKPSGNTKNDRISRTPSSNEKNKVEVQSRKVISSLNKRNSYFKNVCNEHVKHPVKVAKALCSVCNECLFDANHAICLIDHVNSMNVRAKSASKKNKKRKEWKPTGKAFNSIGYKWKPTGRTFTLVGNDYPLTRMEPGTSRGSDTSVAPSSSSLIDCRENHTLVEAARTMLIYAKAHLFLWAEAVATVCYTQNRSIIRRLHGKTPYELLHDRKHDLSYLYVFGALCYQNNDSESLGKLQAKADIGIFIGYAPKKKAYRIHNRHTRKIIKTIHVDFDELTAMVFEQSSLEPALHEMTPATPSSELVPNAHPSAPFVPLVSDIKKRTKSKLKTTKPSTRME